MAINIGNICSKCVSGCLIVSVSCLMDSLLKIPQKHVDIVKQLLDRTQIKYVKPHLGDCFTELCSAIEKANLPLDDINYEALPEKWSTLIDIIFPVLVSGVRYEYEVWNDCQDCTTDIHFQLFVRRTETYLADVHEAEDHLREWLEDNQTNYDCLPLVTVSNTSQEEIRDEYLLNWGTTKGYQQY
jgi:type I site-specific restriction endonuclease